MIRVLVVDDHRAVRESVSAVLGDDPDLAVIGAVASPAEALAVVVRVPPAVALIAQRSASADGLQLCSDLARRHPTVRTIVLASIPSDTIALAAFSAGAHGVVVKDGEPASLRQAVRSVAAGGTFVDPRLAGRIVDLALAERPGAEAPA